jgi:hypothetical protein
MKNEWRVPLTIIMFSSLIFVAVTFLFGVEIDRNTGDMVITTGELENDNIDRWTYDPMTAVWGKFWRYWCLIGYFGSIGIFSYAWFEYMKDEKEVIKK